MMKPGTSEFRCPICANSLSPNALSCGRCGARREGGDWIAPSTYDGLSIGDDEFDYDDFLRKEFGSAAEGKSNWFSGLSVRERFWWLVAVGLLVVMALGYAFNPRA